MHKQKGNTHLIGLVIAMGIVAILAGFMYKSEPGGRKVRGVTNAYMLAAQIGLKEAYVNDDMFPLNNDKAQPYMKSITLGAQTSERKPVKEFNILEGGVIEIMLHATDSKKNPLRAVFIPRMHNVPAVFEWDCWSSNWQNVVEYHELCKYDPAADNTEQSHRDAIRQKAAKRALENQQWRDQNRMQSEKAAQDREEYVRDKSRSFETDAIRQDQERKERDSQDRDRAMREEEYRRLQDEARMRQEAEQKRKQETPQ